VKGGVLVLILLPALGDLLHHRCGVLVLVVVLVG
jgi:hypothetical protein